MLLTNLLKILSIFMLITVVIPSESSAQWDSTGTDIYYNNGNVGIGITNPTTYKFQVNGTSGFGSQIRNYQHGLNSVWNNIDATSTQFGTEGAGGLHLLTNSASRLFIAPTGKIGIGTTNPQRKLAISGEDENTLQLDASTGEPAIMWTQGNSEKWEMRAGSESFGLYNYTHSAWQFYVSSGKVGIGTTTPAAKLDVIGSGTDGANILRLGLDGGRDWVFKQKGSGPGTELLLESQQHKDFYLDATAMYLRNSVDDSPKVKFDLSTGNVGIGTANPIETLSIRSSAVRTTFSIDRQQANRLLIAADAGNNFFIGTNDASDVIKIEGTGSLNNTLVLKTGNVGIGITNPDEKLTVKGKIHAEEIIVDLNIPQPDYVFEEGYKLKSLSEVEHFIKTNKHLPEIPSAKEVEKNGISIGEMQTKLLKKIEELTLYVIDLKKENSELRSQNSEMNKKLTQEITDLKKQISNK